ncbi:Proliferation-associated protein 2G4 [Lobosporangium transversale]|uniref:DNA-binding protein n=1 Tax=Lobosporangium transversale TaxID=64571 RepID=A0A1Y2GF22_9FUNG|nr:DNA-binding protein [Lobosporangium transversale]KAF9916614.1 Proliferation-associated protein 2G4 [Lobosporangium transversale]ORZ09068.1 DNA-binding protein [Lobosporangium transversale]|eukprot:XP_021878695.1 DNA-binding protein [Lobosporangium transversale]
MSKTADKKKLTVTVQEPEDITVANTDVLTKYKAAADITNRVIAQVTAACVDGASVLEICINGDKAIEEATKTVYTKGKISKGVGFPTSLSVNNIICHFSPLASDPEADQKLKTGDMVKIELGAQIDGFGAIAATTIVVGASKENPIKGKQADVLMAAHHAAEAAVRLIRAGNANTPVTDHVQRIAAAYGCKPVEGMLSHQQEKNVIDGKKQIILNPTEGQRQDFEKCTFAENEVYCVDIMISSGDGKIKSSTTRTTIYKKTATNYSLKMQTSRVVLSEITKKFGQFPFNLRLMDDERKARMGLLECIKHNVVNAYDVMEEKDGEFVAQFLFTVCVMPSGPLRITNTPIDLEIIQSEKKIEDEEILKLLASEIRPKKKSANKKKKADAAAAAPAEEKKDE